MNPVIIALLCAAGVIVALLLVAVIRACAIKQPAPAGLKQAPYTPAEEEKYARALSDMVKVPTVSLRGQDDLTQFRALQKEMARLFPRVFSDLELTDIGGSLLLRWPGADSTRPGVLLMGHQDVVTAEEKGWEHDPFSGLIEGGKIHGRGAMDCKCTVAAEFCAVEELLEEGFVPPCDVYLACSIDEEISGHGAPDTVEYLKKQGVRLSAVMDEGGAIVCDAMPGMRGQSAMVGIVEKGYTDVKIYARGAGGHSSTPPRNTPLARLAAFVCRMEKKHPFKKKMTLPVKQMFASLAPRLGFGMRLLLGNLWLFGPLLTWLLPVASPFGEAFLSTTFAFTMCAGSRTPNVIPDEAYVLCNLRPAIHQNSDESVAVLRKYAAKYDLDVEVVEARDASNVVDARGDEFVYLKKCLNECFPDVCVAPYYISGGTDCRNYEAVSDNCLRFCPVRMDNQQLSAMHAANENIDIDALAESVKFYRHYLQNRV